MIAVRWPKRVELGDVMLLFYIAVFVRQYLWVLPNEVVAWVLTAIVSVVLTLLCLFLKEEDGAEVPWQFWLVVGVPLLIVFAMRVALPDTSYDVLNYRLVSGERAIRGWPFIPGDFFPAFYPLNPAPDMLLGIFRHLLGYRLGTVFNLLVFLWAGVALYKILKPYFSQIWLCSLAVLLILWTEHALFVINNYLVDLLALPLLLEAVLISLRENDRNSETRRLVRLGLLLGLCVMLKPLNLAYVIPVGFIYLYTRLAKRERPSWPILLKSAPLALLAFLISLAPYSLYMYGETRNPIFPLYNAIFKSPYWPLGNLYDSRWGARGLTETLLWPLRIAFDATRTGELNVYSGRITLAVLASLISLAIAWRDRRLRTLSFATLLAALVWSAALTGYARYAIFVEMMGGVVLVCAVVRLFSAKENSVGFVLARSAAALLIICLAVQLGRASRYITLFEWSMRPTIFADSTGYWREASLMLRDYDLNRFFDAEDRSRFDEVGAWLESGPLSSGFYALLAPEKPILCAYVPDYFYSVEGRERFDRALRHSADKNLGALCHENDLDSCTRFAADRGLTVVESRPVTMPVYSDRTRLKMYLMKLKLVEVR